jgi:tetratricopeptide (TPR) repeat protein
MYRLLLATSLSALRVFAAEERFFYPLPPDAAISIQAGEVSKNGEESLHFDLYRPTNHASGEALPVVLFIEGPGGADYRQRPQYAGWGKLVTTIGMAGVVYGAKAGGVAESDLLDYLRQNAARLHVDAGSIVVWACSANAIRGLPFAMDPNNSAIKAGVFYYPVIDELKDLRMDLPIQVVRAGLDSPGLNRDIDKFVGQTSAANVPLAFVNVPGAHHGFDVRDDNETSRAIILRTLDFMKTQISPSAQREVRDAIPSATATSAVYRRDFPAALKAYEALSKSQPEDSEVHRNFANVLLELGEFKRAISEFERALAIGNPNQGNISYSAATASMKLGDVNAALNWIEKLKNIAPMRRRLKSDPVFAPLKDNPHFKAIADIP